METKYEKSKKKGQNVISSNPQNANYDDNDFDLIDVDQENYGAISGGAEESNFMGSPAIPFGIGGSYHSNENLQK